MNGRRARPVSDVPAGVRLALAAALAAQIGWHGLRPAPQAEARDLPEPPPLNLLRVASMGDPWTTSRVLMLWLQAFDNQPGISVPFSRLDYDRLARWLDRILGLDPRTEYPLLSAARLYAAVPDEQRRRAMYEYVYRRFLDDPNRRWRWLAHVAIEAKHRLKDLELAHRYARAITEHATGDEVPAWARDMSVSILEDMGEYEAAVFMVYRLLESGRITDPHEIAFLGRKLEALKARIEEDGQER